MPTYQYACTECGHQLEAVQSFTDESLTVCPACAGRLRKQFGSVGIVFKGPGFYRTDSRNGQNGKVESKSEDKSEAKTDSKPAAEKSGSEKSGKSEKSEKSDKSSSGSKDKASSSSAAASSAGS